LSAREWTRIAKGAANPHATTSSTRIGSLRTCLPVAKPLEHVPQTYANQLLVIDQKYLKAAAVDRGIWCTLP